MSLINVTPINSILKKEWEGRYQENKTDWEASGLLAKKGKIRDNKCRKV